MLLRKKKPRTCKCDEQNIFITIQILTITVQVEILARIEFWYY